tara:strand:+ start:6056 stop:6532 length:477 start_codon:yes stop_codon:yes gene_type:complete
MALIEIERKFLVESQDFKTEAVKSIRISQGYLNSNPSRTVRVRIYGDEAFITIKGASDKSGTTRFEWEQSIAVEEADALLELCEQGIIDKMRYEIPQGEHVFEVDEFFGANEGLVVAEIELKHADEKFAHPSWLGQEVTGEIRYYNSQLSKHPFINWL